MQLLLASTYSPIARDVQLAGAVPSRLAQHQGIRHAHLAQPPPTQHPTPTPTPQSSPTRHAVQGWAERAVFGKIRYMNFAGCKRKFDVDKYVARIGVMVKQVKAEAAKAQAGAGAAK